MTDYGVDLSHHNTVTNWKSLQGDSTSFAWMKATEGETFFDPTFSSFIDGARNAGIRVSGYHFAHAGNLTAQVKTFASQLHLKDLLKPGNLAPMLDMEALDLRLDADAFVLDFINLFRSMTGIRPIVVYANLDWFTSVLDPDVWADDDVTLFLARYGFPAGLPGWWHPRLGIHQYTQVGRKNGIAGNVDLDATCPGWTVDRFTLSPAAAPGANTEGGVEMIDRITVTPPDTGMNTVRVKLSGTGSAAVVIRPKLNADRSSVPMWVGNVYAWGSDGVGVGGNPKTNPTYRDRMDMGPRRLAFPGALWADIEYSAQPTAPFEVESY